MPIKLELIAYASRRKHSPAEGGPRDWRTLAYRATALPPRALVAAANTVQRDASLGTGARLPIALRLLLPRALVAAAKTVQRDASLGTGARLPIALRLYCPAPW